MPIKNPTTKYIIPAVRDVNPTGRVPSPSRLPEGVGDGDRNAEDEGAGRGDIGGDGDVPSGPPGLGPGLCPQLGLGAGLGDQLPLEGLGDGDEQFVDGIS